MALSAIVSIHIRGILIVHEDDVLCCESGDPERARCLRGLRRELRSRFLCRMIGLWLRRRSAHVHLDFRARTRHRRLRRDNLLLVYRLLGLGSRSIRGRSGRSRIGRRRECRSGSRRWSRSSYRSGGGLGHRGCHGSRSRRGRLNYRSITTHAHRRGYGLSQYIRECLFPPLFLRICGSETAVLQ